MKKYYLSTSKERITGIIFSLIMIVVLVLMLVALRSNVTILLLTGICVVLVCSILVIYILNVTKAACVPDLENHVLGSRASGSGSSIWTRWHSWRPSP